MQDLIDLLNHLPWLKKVLEIAASLPHDVSGPPDTQELPNCDPIGTYPIELRRIYMALDVAAKEANGAIEAHTKNHPGCQTNCPTMIELSNSCEENEFCWELLCFVAAYMIEKSTEYNGFGMMASDWRIFPSVIEEEKDTELDNAFRSLPPPSAKEKEHWGS